MVLVTDSLNLNVSVQLYWYLSFLGLRHSQIHTSSWRAGVHCGRTSPQWHHPRQTAIPGVGEPILNTKLCQKKPDVHHSCVTVHMSLVLQTQDLQIVCYAFTAFGKAAIKQKKLHPDAFVQLAMQLAYYRLHKGYEGWKFDFYWCLKS